ncbi:hypothetical protein [Streptomyces poriferorum]|uniref:Integral membrane protein n=1 Tax=Streptomyces poriferorum TaxID=2798799 RepID=A0ABY9J563_9ACTN|nr:MULTISPECIES: hypothetical protein [unclassified Streptomyces]MDP5317398.1 hypothetical protein [Streptomyces sp. Alt4]WLQ62004.1 hypothetical protein P8A19_41760 [Streptomyces sp. Alt2]
MNSDRKARKAKLTLAALGVLVAAALVGGGLVAYSMVGPNESNATGDKAPSSPAKPSSTAPTAGSGAAMTPEKAKKVPLSVPTGQANGVSTGFPHSPGGAISAAVYFWEEYAWLDDQKARQQLEAVVSPDATGYVDEQISEIRKIREGVDLPTSGGTPAGLTITTTVQAVRVRSLKSDDLPRGDVVHVWMSFDRYATTPKKATDDDPIKGDTADLIVKWQDGAWKLTNEPQYWAQRTFPVAYAPDSPFAWNDLWLQVRHED